MKFTRDRYQQGSLRRVKRATGPDVWEFRFSTYEDGVRKQTTTNSQCRRNIPTETAVKTEGRSFGFATQLRRSCSALQEPTLASVMEIFADEEMPERLKSQQNYRLLMNKHIRPKWGASAISEIQPYAVESWLKELAYSPETKRHIKSMLYRLFELSMKRGWLEAQRNPMSLVRVKGRNRVIEKVVLTPEQMLIVRQNFEDPYLLMAELACYLGLRICEVLGLMWEDFDLLRGLFRSWIQR